jgi:arylformamidase
MTTVNAGTPNNDKGPKVWRDLDQASLDASYDQQAYAPHFAQVIERMILASRSMHDRLGQPQTYAYGPSEIEKLYFYPAKTANAPVHIHVHGGAWLQRKAETVAFPAESLNAAGINFAVFDFAGVDETGGDLSPVFEQVCRGLAWLANNAKRLGGDPERLFVSGFSSGAHLAGAAMTIDWAKYGYSHNPYKGALLASGMYDLFPVRLSKRSKYVAFNDTIVQELSAQRHIDRFDVPAVIVNGTFETPEFQRQAKDFVEALRSGGRQVTALICAGHGHYEIMEAFGNPYSPLGRTIIDQALHTTVADLVDNAACRSGT